MNRWDEELRDTLEAEHRKRGPSPKVRKPRRKQRRSSPTAGMDQAEAARFGRLRAACCDWSPVDPEEQALNIVRTLRELKARAA